MARVRKDFDSLMKELEEIKNKIEEKKQQEADDIYNFLLKEFKTDNLDLKTFQYWFNNLNKEDKKTLKEVQEEMKIENENESEEDFEDDFKDDNVVDNNGNIYHNNNSKYTNI